MRHILLATACTALLAGTASAAPLFQSGDIFASIGNGQVQVYMPDGTPLTLLDTGQGGFTTGSTTDKAGNFYVTNFSANNVSEFDNNGTSLGIAASGFATPEAIVFNKAGTAYVSQVGGGGIRTFGGASFPVAQGRTDWLDLAANQTTFYYTNEGNAVFTYDLVGGDLSPLYSGLSGGNAFALRILADGSVLVADNSNISHIAANGTLIDAINPTGASGLFSLDVARDGKSYYTGSFNTGDIYHIDLATGALLDTIATGSGQLFGVSVYGEFQSGGGGGGGGGGVPEPATFALFGLGLGAIAVARRRRVG